MYLLNKIHFFQLWTNGIRNAWQPRPLLDVF